MTIWCYSALVHVSEDIIFVTGGINEKYNSISKEVYLYNPVLNIATKLADMHDIRYTHTATFHN